MTKKIIPPSAATPVTTEIHIAVAFQALEKGTATEQQQKDILKALLGPFCGTYDLPYRVDPYETAFATGRMFVGQQIVKHLNINTALLERKK